MKYRFKGGASLILASVLLALSMFVPTTSAVEAPKQGITLEPYIQQLTLEPGQERADFDLKVTNGSGRDSNFTILAIDFGSLNDSGGILFAGTSQSDLIKKYGLADWLSVPGSPVLIRQGQTVTIKISVINDDSLSPGGHYAAILITPVFGFGAGDNLPGLGVSQTISCLVLAIKQSGDAYDLKLREVSDNHNLLKTANEVTLKFHNPGNVHVVPRGVVSLLQDDRVVARGVINEESGFVLPETDRIFKVSLRPVASSRNLFISTYSVKTDYRYDGIDYYASSSYKNVVVGWQSIVVPAILIFFIWWHRKVLQKRVSRLLERLSKK